MHLPHLVLSLIFSFLTLLGVVFLIEPPKSLEFSY
ncbi:Uncharacterised protein [Klebsiella pneumoniae]|nr:Uncharacterised protein [Klebsiella pneumoniae]